MNLTEVVPKPLSSIALLISLIISLLLEKLRKSKELKFKNVYPEHIG
jgi:hypothetical protein